jgi:two-component system sensor histidine kinase KdpD
MALDESFDNTSHQNEIKQETDHGFVKRGRLKLFLGFAAGVGKTYSMLSEANRRAEDRGQDVVIGYVEPHGRKGTDSQIGKLEIIPRKKIEYKGATFDEMDSEAIIARNPTWVVVDELAHTNIPGSSRKKRYEDVLAIMDAGINVLTTMNVQHLESLSDTVIQVTGVKVRETVPDWILREANEIVNIDITPRALIHRLERGEIYSLTKAPQALTNFFREGNLAALREMALREIAREVDKNVQSYRTEQGISDPWQIHERVMICVLPGRPADRLIRRGWRVARRLDADMVVVYVSPQRLSHDEKRAFDCDLDLAVQLNIKVEEISGPSVAQALAKYALANQVTEIVLGHSQKSSWAQMLAGSTVTSLIGLVPGIDVLVIAETEEGKPRRA